MEKYSISNINNNSYEILENTKMFLKKSSNVVENIIDIFETFKENYINLYNDISYENFDFLINIENYNRVLNFYIEKIESELNRTVLLDFDVRVKLIKPVIDSKGIYFHPINVVFVDDTGDVIKEKIGNIPNISINKNREKVIFKRADKNFSLDFITFNDKIKKDRFLEHINKIIDIIDKIKGWLYSDIEYIQNCINSTPLI
jgi:hypothetical protein